MSQPPYHVRVLSTKCMQLNVKKMQFGYWGQSSAFVLNACGEMSFKVPLSSTMACFTT